MNGAYPEKITCRTFFHKNGGIGTLQGSPHATKSVFEIFPYPSRNSSVVLFVNADCNY